jgi:glycosyltransferase involved in cell wall biosynthesis
MKLLFITNGINGSGGLERVLSIKASYLADFYNYEVIIVSLNEGHLNSFYQFSPKIKMISVTVGGNPVVYLQNYKRNIQNVVNDLAPDVISVCDDGLKGFFLPNIIKTSAKWIYERHASIRLNTNSSILGRIKSYLMRRQAANFDKFVVLSKTNMNEWSSSNVIAISNPLSFSMDRKSPLDTKKIIAVGSHSLNKGYDTLLNIWKDLASIYPNWELNIYGKFDAGQTYIKMAEKLGLKKVFFHKPVKNIQEKFLESSIMVLPSRSEGFGMVLIEAMECGVPCVSFDCPSGPRDIIRDQNDGFLVENQNIDVFKRAVENLILDTDLRIQFGENAKINVKRYAVENIIKQWEQLFKSLV